MNKIRIIILQASQSFLITCLPVSSESHTFHSSTEFSYHSRVNFKNFCIKRQFISLKSDSQN